MNRNGWNQRELERLYREYMDRTGILDFRPADIAVWAKENKYRMPKPPTDVEVLALLLQRAGLNARRKDAKTSILYRAALSYPAKVMGEWQMRWFDSDGPTATLEKVLASVRRRKDHAINILVGAKATLAHFVRTHPTEQVEMFDLGISNEEIEWRLLGKNPGSDESKKTG